MAAASVNLARSKDDSPLFRPQPARPVSPAPLVKPAGAYFGHQHLTVIEPTRGWRALDLRELWAYRELLWVLASRDVRVRYKQTFLGAGWALIRPLLTTVLFTAIFGRLAKMPSDGFPYPVFVLSALLPWSFFASAVGSAGGSLVGSSHLISKVYFPRLIIPLSSLGAGLADLAGLDRLAARPDGRGTGVGWSPRLLAAPLLVLAVAFAALGVGTLLAALSVAYRDVHHLTPFVLQIWMYATPVIYPTSLVPERWRWLLLLNPMTGLCRGVPRGLPRQAVRRARARRLRCACRCSFSSPASPISSASSAASRTSSDERARSASTASGRSIGSARRSGARTRSTRLLGNLFRRQAQASGRQSAKDRFWALRDVSFEVEPGEVLGVIGRNGAGKSTLLKILSRITEPTRGRVEIRGRLASLLEVGTGFHPELTGRENIFLNGAILGMRRREIARKFDEIVAFAEIETFLDTPVKRYSSGMYVRLAFAVAAHLEPDILLVDEVLAVGDAEFQKRCLGKMGEVRGEGRTVVFVSHNMAAISALSTRGLLLDHGASRFAGSIEQTIREYLRGAPMATGGQIDLREHPFRRRESAVLLEGIVLRTAEGAAAGVHRCGKPLVIELQLASRAHLREPQFGIGFDDSMGNRVFSVATYLSSSSLPELRGPARVQCVIDDLPLAPAVYTLSLSAGDRGQPLLDAIDHAVGVEVVAADFYGGGILPSTMLGHTLIRSRWNAFDDA